jgi:hypothetical protein
MAGRNGAYKVTTQSMPDIDELDEIIQDIEIGSVIALSLSREDGDPRHHKEMINKAKLAINSLIQKKCNEVRIEQAKETSNWIEKHIQMLHKDSDFKNESSSVAFTYAEDQARQGRYKSVKSLKDKE